MKDIELLFHLFSFCIYHGGIVKHIPTDNQRTHLVERDPQDHPVQPSNQH